MQTTTTGIATIKPKRKYTKRKPSIALVKPKVRKELPKTARAYLSTLGMKADKEGTAVTELIKLHNEMVKKSSQEPAPAITNVLVKSQPKTFWQRWFGK
jgi:hypothetical protein